MLSQPSRHWTLPKACTEVNVTHPEIFIYTLNANNHFLIWNIPGNKRFSAGLQRVFLKSECQISTLWAPGITSGWSQTVSTVTGEFPPGWNPSSIAGKDPPEGRQEGRRLPGRLCNLPSQLAAGEESPPQVPSQPSSLPPWSCHHSSIHPTSWKDDKSCAVKVFLQIALCRVPEISSLNNRSWGMFVVQEEQMKTPNDDWSNADNIYKPGEENMQ